MAEKQGIGFFNVGTECPDLVIENGTLKADNTLETSMLISAFSNRRVGREDLPPGITEQQGWWADQLSEVNGNLIGSRLWTLARKGKIIDETISEMESIILELLNWLIEDGIADTITATSERDGTYGIKGSGEIKKPDGDNIPFSFIWDGQALKLTAV